MWRTLGAVALLVAAHPVLADDVAGYVWGNTTDNWLTINDDTTLRVEKNQGWWSDTFANSSSNDTYFAGRLHLNEDDAEYHLLRSFFVFDISNVDVPVTSATLRLQFFTARSLTTPKADTLWYSLFDVDPTNVAAVLEKNELLPDDVEIGPNEDLYEDLGSGVRYGSFAVSTSLLPDEQVLWNLDGAAFLADLNAAIAGDARYFAIGGTLSFTPTVTRTDNPVPDSGNTLALLGLAAACLWSVRSRKQAA